MNAHAHLDLTGVAPAADLPARPFTAWVAALVRRIEAIEPAEAAEAVRRGLAESRTAGVGLVLDHDSLGVPAAARAGGDVSVIRLREATWDRDGETPHAPHTCPAETIRRLAAGVAASAAGLLSIHAAESPEEVEVFRTGTGALAAYLTARGRPLPEVRATTPVAYLDSLGAVGPRTLLVHMTHASPADLDIAAARGATVVLSPRTAERFGGRADLGGLRRRRIRVALGTDSTATAPDLDLRAEARAAIDLYGCTPAEALRAIGPDAADSLGRPDRGRLAPGAVADLRAVSPAGTPRTDEDAALAALADPWHDLAGR